MGKSSSQVVGYRYYAKFAAFIGNRIEKLIGINFDNRKWVIHDPEKHPPNLLPVLENNLFGENEGGVSGQIDIHFGYPDPEPNATYKQYFPLVSGYPYQSYLIFRGYPGAAAFTPESLAKNGFYLGNSGYMKEMLLWVKRTRVRNDGQGQWYEVREDGAVVCEIGSYLLKSSCYLVEGFIGNPKRIFKSSNPEFNSVQTGAFVFGAGFGVNLNVSASMDFELEYSTAEPIIFDFYQIQLTTKNVSVSCNMPFSLEDFHTDEHYWSKTIKVRLQRGQMKKMVLSVSFSFEGIVGQQNRLFVGSNYEQPVDGLICETPEVESPDINPIHKIREILTDDTAMGKPEADVNNANFIKAADRIYDEGLGISWAIDEKSCIEAIDELCYHIEAGIRVNRQTGLYEMVLFRDDWFSEDEIHDIAENKIKDLSLEVMNSDDIVNQLNVTYYDRERIKNSTFSVYENGSILTMGHANAESVEFPYFMNMRNAEIVANWKLKQFSTPAWSGSFSTGWREARKWNRYDLIRLPWSSKWNGTILVRIMKINLGNGTDNTVTIDFEEVIPYSGEMNTSIVVDESMNEGVIPPQPSVNAVFEAPYYLTVLRAGQTNTDLELSNNPNIGYVAAIAAKPQNNSLNALLYTDGGVDEFEQVSRLDYCDILQLDQPINETMSAFVVTGSLTQTSNLNNLILLNDELMGFVSFDDETKVLTVKRGVLDTVPKKHNSGSLFVFDLPDVAFDSAQYAQSEVVEAQVLTTTPSGVQELLGAGIPVEIQARAIRPYPPANAKINGEYYPTEISGDLTLTWVDRNRIQQTGGAPLGFFDSAITVEDGVTYNAEIYDAQSNIKFAEKLALTSNVAIFEKTELSPLLTRVDLYSMRSGFESYQKYQHIFAWGEPPETFITAFIANGTFAVPQNISAIDVLIVAGGGGGGSRQGGGGGAGGIIVLSNHSVTPGDSIPIIVGDGGAGGINGGPGTDGKNSIFGTVVATGGGGGGGRTTGNNGRVGGSGGGSHLGAPGEATGLQGNKGGTGFKGNKGGGGGGAASAGQDNLRPDGSNVSYGEEDYLSDAGDGGDGLFFPNLAGYGENGYFAGGGGGGGFNTASGAGEGTGGAGKGGTGGGGGGSAGSDSPAITGGPGHNAMPNTGGGGGGSAAGNFAGGAGGSGIVIIVYPAGQLQPIISAKSAVSEIL